MSKEKVQIKDKNNKVRKEKGSGNEGYAKGRRMEKVRKEEGSEWKEKGSSVKRESSEKGEKNKVRKGKGSENEGNR